jgi:NTE family protein
LRRNKQGPPALKRAKPTKAGKRMLRDVSAGVNRLLSGLRRPGAKRVNLALQGGGAHGAFTWGVLDQLLEDGRLAFSGISGASAGAVNAVMLADGLARGGPDEARARLAAFWRAASIGGNLSGAQRAVLDRVMSLLPAGGSPVQIFMDAMSRMLSPYDFNPLNINPLKDLFERFVDFEAIRGFAALELFISATNVHTGRLRVFRREEISADVVMASAALPHVFRAVEIGGEPYWDGGFTANPAILPLIAANANDDVLLVQIAPLARPDTPTSARDILSRVNEISFSSSLAAELRALDYIGRLRAQDAVKVHRIQLEGVERKLGTGSRLKTDFDFFARLHRAGRRAARRFLDRHFDDIGRRSTLDLAKETAA